MKELAVLGCLIFHWRHHQIRLLAYGHAWEKVCVKCLRIIESGRNYT